MKSFYLTTTLPYVNAPLHLGHATEIIRADAIARYKKLKGFDVFFNTGTDEHGQKIFESAQKSGQTPEQYTNHYANLFKETLEKFGIENTGDYAPHYVRTTDERHIHAAQKFWNICVDNGYIYKKNYKTKYCVGCEEEKTDSELEHGRCPIHPNREIEHIEEENYFFKFSDFGEKLLAYYDLNPGFIIPESRMNEMREFVKRGLQDFSISRLKSKMSWGIPVPGDEDHVMYVWFDALTNYISTLGWPETLENFEKFWVHGTPTQYCGKDNTRFQAVMWQAMLLAAGLPQSNKIVVDGFILGEGGVKMSKSLGNVVDPLDIVSEYGIDALRFFVLHDFHSFEDTPVSMQSLKESYNAHLANGIGNLTSRIMKMATVHISDRPEWMPNFVDTPKDFQSALDNFDIQKAAQIVWHSISELDKRIQAEEPFKLVKTEPEKGKQVIDELRKELAKIAQCLLVITPETARTILECIENHKMPENPLFVRKD